MLQEIPVLIVGAGPTGLTLACDLARRNVDFRIIDKSPAFFAGSRGKGLQPRSLEVLDDLGVIDSILANGRFHLPFRGYEGQTILGDRDIHEGRHPTPDVPYASSLIIPQFRVEEILRHRLAGFGKHVELATEFVDLTQDQDHAEATLQHDGATEPIRAKYVVAADGGRSFTRKHLNVGFEGETRPDERMLIADVRCPVLDRDHWHAWAKHPDGWLALCPLPSTDAFQLQAAIPPDEPDEPTLERLQQIVDQRTAWPELKLRDPTWTSLYRVNIRMVDKFRVGRVFLAGDAAHVHSPAGGQGMNTGIQDAYNLGWKLAAVLAGAPEALLDTYEEERLPIAAWLLGVTTNLHRNITASDIRDPEFLQLGLNYRGSSLAPPSSISSTLQPGDRAPDSPLRDSAGNTIRLFDLFRGPHFTLLRFVSHAAFASELPYADEPLVHVHSVVRSNDASLSPGEVADHEGHAWKTYGIASDALILVRPDGYIAFIGDAASTAQIKQYLNQMLS